MPRKQQNYEELLAETVADAIMNDADKMAAESGPPPGRRSSEDEEVRLWGLRDPNVQYDATLRTLQTTGFGETAEQLVVVQENPDLLGAYAAPSPDPETAAALATLAEYPFRASLWSHLGDPDDRVAVANRVNKAWQKTQPAPAPVEPVAAPAPVMPAVAPMAAPEMAAPVAPEMQAPAPTPPVNGTGGGLI